MDGKRQTAGSRALIVHYSRTGHTARLAAVLEDEMRRRGYDIDTETIRVKRDWSLWLLPLPLLPLLPVLPLYLISARFRRVWHRIYPQPEQAIRALAFPDVSAYDLVLLGTPKWLYLSFPVARWLKMASGLQGKRVATFATFCGPPLKVFELEMLFEPLESRIRGRGATVIDRLGLSSNYHPYFSFGGMENLFRFISRSVFKRPLVDFTLDGQVGTAEVQRFCDTVCGKSIKRE